MQGQLSEETEVRVPAGMVWDVYKGLELGKLVDQLLPDVLGRVEVIQGDGGVGTVVKLTFPEGTPGVSYLKERFTKIDEEKRVKETEIIEGGFLELGFHLYRVRLEIIEKDGESSIIRSTVEYEVDEEHADNASLVSTKALGIMAQVIGSYLADNKIKPTA
uniref:Bet v I/Major latex protein domain-containing protein n=1 Tax=Davidia involucrata TaxID=16924 RepID=A0A5B6YX15_DAVIN